jgi:hypothetical protein
MVQRLTGDDEIPRASVEPDNLWDDVQQIVSSLPATPSSAGASLQYFKSSSPLPEIVRALQQDGACVLERVVTEDVCDGIISQMQPYLNATGHGDGFLGRQTKRAGAVVSRSPASWKCIMHPLLMKLCEGVLGRQVLHMTRAQLQERLSPGNKQLPWQLSLSQVSCIGSYGVCACHVKYL